MSSAPWENKKWKDKRLKMLGNNSRCEYCGSSVSLCVHHKTKLSDNIELIRKALEYYYVESEEDFVYLFLHVLTREEQNVVGRDAKARYDIWCNDASIVVAWKRMLSDLRAMYEVLDDVVIICKSCHYKEHGSGI